MMITAQEISEATGLPTYEQMKEWCEANAEGRLLILPCKVGDVVWRVNFDKRHKRIEEIRFDVNLYNAFGKTIFRTREEAEAALGGANK